MTIRQRNQGYIDRVNQNVLQELDILDINKSHLFKVGLDFYLNKIYLSK